jgi:hypothetical protein
LRRARVANFIRVVENMGGVVCISVKGSGHERFQFALNLVHADFIA